MHLIKCDDLIAFTVASLANVDLYEQAMTSSQLAMGHQGTKIFAPRLGAPFRYVSLRIATRRVSEEQFQPNHNAPR